MGNTANNGGAVYNIHGRVDVTACEFRRNRAVSHGGAIWVWSATISIDGSTFTDNEGEFGGAIVAHRSAFTIRDSSLSDNDAFQGGALLLGSGRNGPMSVDRCSLVGNSATLGGGIATLSTGWVVVIDSLFERNKAYSYGAGAAISNGSTLFSNCTFVGNNAWSLAGGVLADPGTTFYNCILWDNVSNIGDPFRDEFAQIEGIHAVQIDFSIIQGWTGTYGGVGNSGDDPLFVAYPGPDGSFGTLDDDLRLSPDSPAINAGDPEYISYPGEADLDGKPRILCGRADLGAFEHGTPGDANCDSLVNINDYADWPVCMTGPRVTPNWWDGTGGDFEPLVPPCIALDLVPDGNLDLADLAIFQRVLTEP